MNTPQLLQVQANLVVMLTDLMTETEQIKVGIDPGTTAMKQIRVTQRALNQLTRALTDAITAMLLPEASDAEIDATLDRLSIELNFTPPL